MDELQLLRRALSDDAPPSDDALERGRAALDAHMAEAAAALGQETTGGATVTPISAACPGRRRWLGVVAASGVAAALVAGLVLTDTIGLAGWRGGADAAAADVLRSASVAAIDSVDPALAPGQYRRIDTVAVASGNLGKDDGEERGFLFLTRSELYIPADPADDWVWMRGLDEPYQTFGPRSRAASDADWKRQIDKRGSADYQENVRAPGGAFYGTTSDLDEIDSLPRDPMRLLNHIYRVTLGTGPSTDGEALVWIADLLRTGAAPADLRAALFEAAAMIPGVVITEQQAVLDGRTGVAIGRVESSSGQRQDIIIDPATGQLIGERHVNVGNPDSSIPIGSAESWTAVTTTVVDSAPQGGSVYGHMSSEVG